MTVLITEVLPTVPQAPSLDDPENFDTEADAWAASLSPLQVSMNLYRTQANALATDVNASLQAAQAAQAASELAQDLATQAAIIAQSTVGAETYIPNQAYNLNATVISPVDHLLYRKKTATSSSALDPSADSTNWLLLSAAEALPLTGGTMTGPIGLAADPVLPMQPVTLQYLQANSSNLAVLHAAILSF